MFDRIAVDYCVYRLRVKGGSVLIIHTLKKTKKDYSGQEPYIFIHPFAPKVDCRLKGVGPLRVGPSKVGP